MAAQLAASQEGLSSVSKYIICLLLSAPNFSIKIDLAQIAWSF
jgi:hypothetical protein